MDSKFYTTNHLIFILNTSVWSETVARCPVISSKTICVDMTKFSDVVWTFSDRFEHTSAPVAYYNSRHGVSTTAVYTIKLHVLVKLRLAEAVSKIQNALFSSQCFLQLKRRARFIFRPISLPLCSKETVMLHCEPQKLSQSPLSFSSSRNELSLSLLFFPSMTYPVYLHTHPPVMAAGRHSPIAHHTPLHNVSAETVRQETSKSSPDVYLACVSLCCFNCSAF